MVSFPIRISSCTASNNSSIQNINDNFNMTNPWYIIMFIFVHIYIPLLHHENNDKTIQIIWQWRQVWLCGDVDFDEMDWPRSDNDGIDIWVWGLKRYERMMMIFAGRQTPSWGDPGRGETTSRGKSHHQCNVDHLWYI